MNMFKPDVQTVGTRISQWGEGPIWWRDKLFYVDIEGHALIQLDVDTNTETIWDVGERIGTVVPHELGGVIYAGDSGIIAFDLNSGAENSDLKATYDLTLAVAGGTRTASEEMGHREFIMGYKTFEPLGPACLPAA